MFTPTNPPAIGSLLDRTVEVGSDHDPVIAPGVVDALIDALVRAPDPAARARILDRVIDELCETVAGLGAGSSIEELVGLEGVLAAARYHRHRMGDLAARSAGPAADRPWAAGA